MREVRRKNRKAVVRKESANTLEHESRQLNDMDENKEELSFIPSAVSSWHEPKLICDRQCWKKGLQYMDIASLPRLLQSEARRQEGASASSR